MTAHQKGRVDTEAAAAGWDFDSWYRRGYRAVLAYAVSLTGNLSVAEDIVQDGFAAASAKWVELSNHPNPSGWIRRVVLNKSTSRFRHLIVHRKVQHLLARRNEELGALPDQEVWDAVRRLPRRQAQAVALHYLEDLPVTEIAEILGCSSGSVKTHLSRGREALRAALGEESSDAR